MASRRLKLALPRSRRQGSPKVTRGPGLDTGEDHQRILKQAGTTPASDPDHRHNADERVAALCVEA